MLTEAAACSAVIGLDVGRFSHWACRVTRQGEVLGSGPVASTERDPDSLFSQVGAGTLVVVDQVRNIGSPAISRARLAGLPVAYPPGIAAHGAARLFAGDAKTDERDAAVTAKTALGIPDSLLPVPRRDERLGAARSMAAQRGHMATCSTRDENGLRSILLESCPAFEALADLADPHWLAMPESLGGASRTRARRPSGPWPAVRTGPGWTRRSRRSRHRRARRSTRPWRRTRRRGCLPGESGNPWGKPTGWTGGQPRCRRKTAPAHVCRPCRGSAPGPRPSP